MKKFYTIQVYLPVTTLEATVENFKKSGILVDDMQETNFNSRLVELWIPKENVTKKILTEKVGYFIGDNNENQ